MARKYHYMMNVLYNNGSTDVFNVPEFNDGDRFDMSALRNPNLSGLWLTALEPVIKTGAIIFSKPSDLASARFVDAFHRKLALPQIELYVMHHKYRESNVYRGKVLENEWMVHEHVWLLLCEIKDLHTRVPGADGTAIDVVTVQAKRTAHRTYGGGGAKFASFLKAA